MDSPHIVWAFLAVGFVMMGISIAALVDVLRSEFRGANDKLRWATFVVVLGIVGAILYFAIGTKYKRSY
jgi:hypothetical protein